MDALANSQVSISSNTVAPVIITNSNATIQMGDMQLEYMYITLMRRPVLEASVLSSDQSAFFVPDSASICFTFS